MGTGPECITHIPGCEKCLGRPLTKHQMNSPGALGSRKTKRLPGVLALTAKVSSHAPVLQGPSRDCRPGPQPPHGRPRECQRPVWAFTASILC